MPQQSSNSSTPGKLWGGRFTGGLDNLMNKYNQSIWDDRNFYKYDIAGSVAWAKANHKVGNLSVDELQKIISGLQEIEREWKENTFQIQNDEDIHSANERRLSELIGKEVGGKLHTGRSRNEQVITDMRLWLVEQLRQIALWIEDLIKVITQRAEIEVEVLMAGYTHLQRAQPVRWSHWLCSYGLAFASDLERLREVIKRMNKSPLGCGALAGNPFRIDRDFLAKELGFEGLLMNSMTAVGDRKFVVETMQWAAELMGDFSRISEDLIIWSTAEFGFVKLADAYSTGSSLMPQKKNPDSLELLRGKSGTVIGQMVGLTCTINSLPSTYNKDLQESLKPMLECITTVSDSVRILCGVISTLTIYPANMRKALTPDMLATDLADHLVRKGVPFRETHHISGRVVALAEERKVPMDKLSHEDLQGVDGRFGEDFEFNYETSVELRNAKGGTSRASVKEQIELLKSMVTS